MPKKGLGPSVKDKELYDKLRDEGNSKQKAGRIANAAAGSSRKKVSRKGGRSPSYNDWSLSKLRRKAKKVGIKGRSAMPKKKLIKALRQALTESQRNPPLPLPSRRRVVEPPALVRLGAAQPATPREAIRVLMARHP